MTDETKQKILDSALKEFAAKGYVGATTLHIAEKAGFSEKTLFRKFETKRNLYDSVMIQNMIKMKENFDSILSVSGFENPREFLEYFIKKAAKWYDDHFEAYNLALSEDNQILEPMMNEFYTVTTEYFERNLPNTKVDHRIFALGISTFLYVLALEKYHGRTVINQEEAIEKFIDNSLMCIQ